MTRRRIVTTAFTALALLAIASPAAAYLRDVTVAGSTQGFASPFGSDTANCADNPTPISAGAQLLTGAPKQAAGSGFNHNLGINALYPNAQFQGSTGGAVETDPFEGPWAMRVFAICADPQAAPPDGDTGPGYVGGVEIIHTQSVVDANDSKTITARCPEGKNIIGGGGDTDINSPKNLALDQSAPNADNTAWVVGAHEVDPVTKPWQVESKAICADLNRTFGNRYVDGVEYDLTNTPMNLASPKKSVSTCPLGKNIIGGGGFIQGMETPPVDVVLTRNQPRSDESKDTQWVAQGEASDPTSEKWQVITVAVCANIKAPADPPQ